jgi:hypothetical protein
MSKYAILFLGLTLIVVGALKTWMHLQTARTLLVPGCLGSDFIIRLDAPITLQTHCWGCYVALTGTALVAGTMLRVHHLHRNARLRARNYRAG